MLLDQHHDGHGGELFSHRAGLEDGLLASRGRLCSRLATPYPADSTTLPFWRTITAHPGICFFFRYSFTKSLARSAPPATAEPARGAVASSNAVSIRLPRR